MTYLANGNIYPSYEINDLPVGLHDISIVDDNGCTVDSVINLPDPNIVAFNSYTICFGDSLLMDGLANFSEFNTFIWLDDSGILSDETSVIVSPEQTTNYFVSAFDNGCYSIHHF